VAEKPTSATFITLAIGAVIVAIFSYLIVRTGLFLAADYLWYEKIVALLLLFAECFALVHAVGYFLNVYHVLHPGKSSRISLDNIPELTSYPPVAVIVSAFKEPLDVLEDTLTCFYNLTYPNKRVYLLDDTRYDMPGDDPVKMAVYRKDIEAMCERIGINLFRRRWRGGQSRDDQRFPAIRGRRSPGGI
jgi:cellulose synthase (UDP-forming)